MREVEGQSLTADGRRIPVEIRSSLVEYNGERAVFVSVRPMAQQNLFELSERLRAEIDQAEDEMLSDHIRGLRPRLGRLRREAVAMHRRIVPEYHAINQLAARLPTWVSETEHAFFRQVADEVGSLVSDIREAQERARVLQDEYAAKIAEETSWNLYVLSMVTVVMLPMTFLTGFFGMNTSHLPFLDPDGLGTWGSGGLTLLVGVVTLALLRSTLWKSHRDR